ncbi:hypothetical protein MTR67_048003 [Solanum verrucosum]|uniref:Uncharacterized protein n=1 Tax=Solanum verrucosum TaxID=315347 RepID=A0AAF0ZYS1_SOLVR|nr:hypothetical protein MTR67_048003 [Solanum verrucosum]
MQKKASTEVIYRP